MRIEQIHHVAYRCKDAKQAVEWYNEMLKKGFVLTIAEDRVPSTHEPASYMYNFMDAGNGNVLAFLSCRPSRKWTVTATRRSGSSTSPLR